MPRIMRNRGSTEPYRMYMNGNYYAPNGEGYGMGEKEEILNQVSANVMCRNYQRDARSVRRTYVTWQMSK